jgi:hypothetical protein
VTCASLALAGKTLHLDAPVEGKNAGSGEDGHGRTNPSVPRPRLPPTSAPERERHTGGASVLDPNSHTQAFRGADEGRVRRLLAGARGSALGQDEPLRSRMAEKDRSSRFHRGSVNGRNRRY